VINTFWDIDAGKGTGTPAELAGGMLMRGISFSRACKRSNEANHRMRHAKRLNGSLWTCAIAFLLFALMQLGSLDVGAAAAAGCSNQGFRTGYSASLPDCRAYEQVSPADKNGGSVGGAPGLLVAAEEGPGATFFGPLGTGVPVSGTGASADYPTYLATRGQNSWTSQSLMPPQELGEAADWLGSTPDLRFDVVEAEQIGFEEPGYGRGLYVIDTATGLPTQIVPNEANELELPYAFDGASSDGSRIFFETEVPVAPGATAGHDNLYMWERNTGKVTYVGLIPEEATAASCVGALGEGNCVPVEGSFGGAYEWYEESNVSAGGALKGLAVGALHAISPSGNQIYFTAAESGQLYLRRGLSGNTPETVHVSKPNPGVASPPTLRPAAFQEATKEGSLAFFISGSKLTSNATTGATEAGSDLYRYDEASESLIDITPDSNNETPNGAEVLGLIGASSDGNSGYFVARGVLDAGAVAGSLNLYRFVWSGSESTITFVATLRSNAAGRIPADTQNWSPRTDESAPIVNDPKPKTARVSANGEVLLFSSLNPITGYENTGPKCRTDTEPESPELRCPELFRFDASSNELVCVSCGIPGQPVYGGATLQSKEINLKETQYPGRLANSAPAVSFSRNLSSDGTKIFFQTPQPLATANDLNGSTECQGINKLNSHSNFELRCQDVYEWEAPNSGGSCTQAELNGGCLYLLSNGQSEAASYFADASADGSNVYLLTTSRLTHSDSDEALDLYDAMIGGGLASQSEVPSSTCSGEACLGPATPAPPALSPASSQIQERGNLSHPKKRKHKGGKSVVKKKAKKHRHKQSKHHKHQGKGHRSTDRRQTVPKISSDAARNSLATASQGGK
jgi:hypothetical protein